MVSDGGHTLLPGTVGAAVEFCIRFYTMADDFAATMVTDWRQLLDRTFETIERVLFLAHNHIKR